MSADRVDKFLSDSEALVAAFLKPRPDGGASGELKGPVEAKRVKALGVETDRFGRWLQKHQDENLPDGHKDKVVAVAQRYRGLFKICASAPADMCPPEAFEAVKEKVMSVIEVYLMLPEGKLATGRSKKQLLKYLEEMQGMAPGSSVPVEPSRATLEVCDVSSRNKDHTALLMDPETGGDSEILVTLPDKATFRAINAPFEEGKVVRVTFDTETQGFVSFSVSEE